MNEFLERYEKLGNKIKQSEIKVPQAIRINTLKIKETALINRFKKENVTLTKIPYLDFGYLVESPGFSIGAAPEHLFGYYYVQESAAQVPAQVLNPKPGEVVLDMASAPGGKTTQMAQMMQNKGVIVALDINNMRLMSLRNNIERMGATNVIVYQKDAQFANDMGIKFDKVLLDAPCAGNFAVDNKWFDKRTIENSKEMSQIQKKLFKTAVEVLKKNGELVYSTCSLEPEEDELVIDWAIRSFPEIKIEKIDLNVGDPGLIDILGKKLNPDVEFAKRFWPNKTKTQGFFIAKFRKIA